MNLKNLPAAVSILAATALATIVSFSPVAAATERPGAFTVESFHSPTTTVSQAHLDQITRLYLTTLGREPGEAGQMYWAELLVNGSTVIAVARYMLATPEPLATTSGDLIVDAYKNALGRSPDDAGYEFWSQYDSVAAVVAISDSAEHIAATGTLAPPHPQIRSFASRLGWVDAGHGVFLPPVMLAVRECESSGNYVAANPRSTARGAYQFLTGSWAGYGHAARYGVSTADRATPAEQDEAAAVTWLIDGTRPWNASRHCWG